MLTNFFHLAHDFLHLCNSRRGDDRQWEAGRTHRSHEGARAIPLLAGSGALHRAIRSLRSVDEASSVSCALTYCPTRFEAGWRVAVWPRRHTFLLNLPQGELHGNLVRVMCVRSLSPCWQLSRGKACRRRRHFPPAWVPWRGTGQASTPIWAARQLLLIKQQLPEEHLLLQSSLGAGDGAPRFVKEPAQSPTATPGRARAGFRAAREPCRRGPGRENSRGRPAPRCAGARRRREADRRD